MATVFSNELAGMLTPGPVPAVLIDIKGDGQTAKVRVQLPIVDQAGGPVKVMSLLSVFYKKSSMIGSNAEAELAAGTPYVSAAVTPDQAGQTVVVEIPNLDYDVEYFFDAALV